jgi:hypothetical protein
MIGGRPNNSKNITFIIDNQVLANILDGPDGMAMVYLIKRCVVLQDAAKNQIRMGHVHAGGGYGNLRDSIVKRIMPGKYPDSMPQAQVGSQHPIALMHHEGTKPHEIRPRVAKILRFPAAWAPGGFALAMVVQHPGTSPNRYLTDNLHLTVEG